MPALEETEHKEALCVSMHHDAAHPHFAFLR